MSHPDDHNMSDVFPSIMTVLDDLLRAAGLPAATIVRQLTGRGFDNEVHVARLAGGRQVVVRRWRQRREPEQDRSMFLAAHGVPAPRLLAATGDASLYDFAPGTLLGDLIETGRASPETWRMVGRAYRHVHDIRFPAALVGEVQPHQIILRPGDPVRQMHTWIEESIPGLRQRAPDALEHLPALHDIVDHAAVSLRTAPTSLLHGDVNMWNIIVSEDNATLIDWDYPQVGAPAMEVALLDKHAALFNGCGLDAAFFEGYGHAPVEPNTSLHRVVQTMTWAASSDWSAFAQADLPADLHERTRAWLKVLLAYVAQLPAHIERLRTLV